MEEIKVEAASRELAAVDTTKRIAINPKLARTLLSDFIDSPKSYLSAPAHVKVLPDNAVEEVGLIEFHEISNQRYIGERFAGIWYTPADEACNLFKQLATVAGLPEGYTDIGDTHLVLGRHISPFHYSLTTMVNVTFESESDNPRLNSEYQLMLMSQPSDADPQLTIGRLSNFAFELSKPPYGIAPFGTVI